MSGESTSIRDGCVAPHVSDPDDTMVGTLGPTETEAQASPREDDDAPAEHIGPEPEQLKRKSVGVPGYHHIRRTYPTPILSPRTKRPRLVPAKYEGGEAARADRASSPKVPRKPKDKKLTGIPGLRYICRTRIGRYEVHFWRRKGECLIKGRTRSSQNTYLGTVDTLEEALEVYNKEARKIGKPTQEIPAGYVAPEPDVAPTVTQAPKHTSSPNDQKKKEKRTTVPGYSGIRVSSNTGRFEVTFGKKPDRLCLGNVDTLREAVELYNKEAKKRGKPMYSLPDDELDVPELNVYSTVVPGLQGINMMTVDGKYRPQIYQDGENYHFGLGYDTLDEAVKEQNAAGAAHVSEWVTRKITAEHRAVVKEMQRKRELIIAEKAKSRKKLAKQKPAPAITRLRPRPEPTAKKAAPPRANTPKKPAGAAKESAPAEMTSTGGASAAAAAAAAPAHLDQSAELDRLREENEQATGDEREPPRHGAEDDGHGGPQVPGDAVRTSE